MAEVEVLAEESYRELLDLLNWFSLHGPIPTLIGGWAVFIYNSYLGSVDIDLVGPSMEGHFSDIIERFERTHGYEEERRNMLGLERVFRKPILKEGKLHGYIELDACTFESNLAYFHENPEKKLPYSLCSDPKMVNKIVIDGKCEVFVPKKPLLFLYKLKALRDRTFDLRTKGAVLSAEKRVWLQSKLTKDGSDLIALLDPEPQRFIRQEKFEFSLLKGLVETYRLHFAFESVRKLPEMRESLERHSNVDQEKVKEWVNTLSPFLVNRDAGVASLGDNSNS